MRGYVPERARSSVENVYRTMREVFRIAREDRTSTAEAADRYAEARLHGIGRLRGYWVPGGKGWSTDPRG